MVPVKPNPFLIEVASGDRFEIGDPFTIGRSSSSDLVLDSRRVSRQHAMIRGDGADGYLYYDLNSSNGSWVSATLLDQQHRLGDR